MDRKALLIVILLGFCIIQGSGQIIKKRLAGPPSEFSHFVPPKPQDAAQQQRSAQFFFKLQNGNGKPGAGMSWGTSLQVDSDTLFAFGVFTPFQYTASLIDPNGNQVDLSQHIVKSAETAFPIGQGKIPGVVYVFNAPFPTGEYKLKIETSSTLSSKLRQLHASEEADGLVILFNDSPVRAHSYLSTYNLQEGQQVGLVTMVTNDPQGTKNPRPLNDTIFSAVMEVYDPQGHLMEIKMHDDGLHSDGVANDGIFGGSYDATETGIYRAEAVILGTHADGTSFVRSTQHLLPVVANELTLTGSAFTAPQDSDRFNIFVSVVTNSQETSNTQFRAYAELYGKDNHGNDIAVCWLGGMIDVVEMNDQQVFALEVNKDWLRMAGAKGPLTLKNVVVHDAFVHIPLSSDAEIPVQTDLSHLPVVTGRVHMEITREMREGKRKLNLTASAATPDLLLLHGYCSGVNPWETSKKFVNAAFFLEPSASMTNDAFAQAVVKYANSLGMTKFSGIGHSQGGVVLVHILNYYETGLDESTGGRRIQTVGTPFQGNSGAGSAANLIKIFGYGCGENFDLTKEGTELWLNGIRSEVMKEVFYYTTTYKQGNLFGDYCNMAVNLVLEWPNDGTTELVYTDLAGATDCGNTEKWCHTTDMAYDAQYYDETRNAEMNSKAAR